MNRTVLAAAPILLAAATAHAQPSAPSTPPPAVYTQQAKPESKDSINVSPLGLLFGNLYVTYEHLFNGKHGVIVDLGYGRSSNEDGAEDHGELGVGYRWHWRGRQNSGFLGVSFHQSYGSGYMTYMPDTAEEQRYDMTVKSTMLTANVGKRWMLGDSWNITLRFGLGLGKHTATAEEDTAEAKMAEEDMNALLSLIPIGWEGELSVGYNF